MRRHRFFALFALAAIWIIWAEELSLFTAVLGLLMGCVCLYISHKFIPLKELRDVRFSKLILYPFYLAGQIYLQGLVVIKIIFTGGRVDIVKTKTSLQSDFLKAMLINSVTLTPGSIPLDLQGGKLTVLNLSHKHEKNVIDVVDQLRARLEKRLLRAQK